MMADYTITNEAFGAYEIGLTANTPVTVQLETRNQYALTTAQVMVHTASSPIYVRSGTTVTTKDPRSTVALPGSWVDIPVGYETPTLSIISADDATVSVSKV
jgi:hypothetical protein